MATRPEPEGDGVGEVALMPIVSRLAELGGAIDWHTLEGEGTEVTIEVPLRWVTKTK